MLPDPDDTTAAEAVRLAAIAKTEVMKGGARAATGLSVLEIVAMARVLDVLLADAFPERRGRTPPADLPKPARDL